MANKISIICPVYNSAKVIGSCIKSILNQTYTNFELILVYDCSPDNSLEVINRWARKDSRIKVYSNERNLGIEATRYHGIEKATGEYIMFIDHDDFMSRDAMQTLMEIMQREKVDVVCSQFVRVLDRFGLIKKTYPLNQNVDYDKRLTNPEFFNKYFMSFFGENLFSFNVWSKLYDRRLIERAAPKPGGYKMSDDYWFNLQLFPYIESTYISSKAFYFYKWGGMTSHYNPNFYHDFGLFDRVKLIDKYNYDRAYESYFEEYRRCVDSVVTSRISAGIDNREQSLDFITTELEKRGQLPYMRKYYADKPMPAFVKEMVDKKADAIYDKCHADAMHSSGIKGKIMEWLLNFISKI